MLGLPGSAYLYQGEELGLPDATRLPDDVRQDPTWERSNHTQRGRDGCRVPMPWEGSTPSLGFGPGAESWLPQPAEYGALAVDRQRGVEGSTLELYRQLLSLRRELRLGAGSLTWFDAGSDDVVAFTIVGRRRSHGAGAGEPRDVAGASPRRRAGAGVELSGRVGRARCADRHCGLGGDRSAGLTCSCGCHHLRQYVQFT